MCNVIFISFKYCISTIHLRSKFFLLSMVILLNCWIKTKKDATRIERYHTVIQVPQISWDNFGLLLAICRTSLAHSNKYPLCRTITKLTVYQQSPSSVTTFCYSKYCSDTRQIRGISAPTISKQFTNSITLNPNISKRFPHIANDRSKKLCWWGYPNQKGIYNREDNRKTHHRMVRISAIIVHKCFDEWQRSFVTLLNKYWLQEGLLWRQIIVTRKEKPYVVTRPNRAETTISSYSDHQYPI